MKTHQSRPVVEELQELRAIAAREHGPHAHSTRLIDRALADARQALQQSGSLPPSRPSSPSSPAGSRAGSAQPLREGPAR